MCEFISAILTKDNRLFCDPEHTDSHEDLIDVAGLADDTADPARMTFARVGYVPDPNKDLTKKSSWELYIDQLIVPTWLTDKRRSLLRDRMWSIAKKVVVTDHRDLLLGGCYIIAGSASVRRIKNSRIYAVYESAKIDYVCESAIIVNVHGSAEIGSVSGSAGIVRVFDSAKIGSVYDSAKIGCVSGSAKIGNVHDSAKIGSVYESARIGYVSGSAKIGNVHDSAVIGNVYGSAKIENDTREK